MEALGQGQNDIVAASLKKPVVVYVPPVLRFIGELSRLTRGSRSGVGESVGGGLQRRQPF